MPTGAASGLIVLDIDQKKGKDGARSLDLLIEELRSLPDTKSAETPSGGGKHLFFKHVDGVHNSEGRLGIGLDVRVMAAT